GVSCVSATSCKAVGWYVSGSMFRTLVESYDITPPILTDAAPAAAGRSDGYLFVFAKTSSGHIMFNQAASGGAFVGWQEVPRGLVTEAPVAAGEQGTTLVVFAKTASSHIMFNQAAKGGAFVGWRAMPGNLVTDAAPAAAGRSDGYLFVFAKTS